MHALPRPLPRLAALFAAASLAAATAFADPGLLFHLSGDRGTTADYSAAGTPQPTYERDITPIADGARAGALQCADLQLLAYRAPGNIYAQRGTLAFFWRSRYPVGPTPFPVFRVGYAEHSSWDMVWLRLDYNGHGFDAFVTDASLSRTRVSVPLQPFPAPNQWTHLAFSWDETRGVRLYVNGQLAAKAGTAARYDAALDQFGPHSRIIISPYQVQSDYNFVRGGDIDEVRIYDRMLDDTAVATLARGDAPSASAASAVAAAPALSDPATRDAWWFRYGFNRAGDPPPYYAGAALSVRKVEIHDAFDLARWWWKATDGIRDTTWPGVYNRSRLPGRHDYFELPDWDCYFDSGKAVTFTLPAEPANHLEIAGAAWGTMTRDGATKLFDRPKGNEHTTHALTAPLTGGKLTFTNVEKEEPIGELGAYHVTATREPAGSAKLAFRLAAAAPTDTSLAPLVSFIAGRHPPAERTTLVAQAVGASSLATPPSAAIVNPNSALPLVHVLIPNTWDHLTDGLDGLALDLPALGGAPTHGGLIPLNLQVKDPLWPLRNLLDFTFSVKPGEAKSLWLDTRDRLLPKGRALYLTVASAGGELALASAELRLVFKPAAAARAEHELDRFTQVRDNYAMLVEEHPNNPRLDMWNRFKGDLDDLLRVNPDHALGRAYAAAGAGAPRPAFTPAEPPAGVPPWAFRQVDLLGRVKKFVMWYVDRRQSAYGDFGGGISDDTDFTNLWPGLALMGSEPDKLRLSLNRLLDATYKNGMFTNGLPTIQADELHSYEEGINCLAQNLMVDYGSPRQLERAMVTARGIETITGVNAAGHRHIRTSYYSGTKMALEEPWGRSKPYSYLVLQVPQLLVDYNGSPAAKKYLLELADGLLAHRKPGTGNRNSLPGSIHFDSDQEGTATRGIFPWHVFWGAWQWTADRKYLEPIADGGLTTYAAVNANTLDLLALRPEWSRRLGIGERVGPNETRRPDGRTRSPEASFRQSSTEHFAWQLDGDKRRLEAVYAQQIEQCALLEYINTEGSLWIDRVGAPTAELQRARLGGVALLRNALYPGHVVSWNFAAPANDQSVAILIPDATTTAFKVIAFNLETAPVRATMTGWNIDPGQWEITQGVDSNDDDVADGDVAKRTEKFERSATLAFMFAPRTTTVLTFKRTTPGTPYWQRPDLGLDREDVTVTAGAVRVRIHSLGSVPASATTVALRNAAGAIVATASVPALAAPNDLLPKTAEVSLAVPAGFNTAGATVEIDPDHRLEEITARNNAVKL